MTQSIASISVTITDDIPPSPNQSDMIFPMQEEENNHKEESKVISEREILVEANIITDEEDSVRVAESVEEEMDDMSLSSKTLTEIE